MITNSGAGSNEAERLEEALHVLRAHADVEVAETQDQGELDGVLHRRGGRRVVVAGGDGSLHAVVAALHRRHELADAVVGLLPLGTGNDFARGVGIPLDPAEAAEVVVSGEVMPVDLIVDCVGEIVVNNVHVGVGAQASHNAKSWKWLGRAGYVVGAFTAAVRPPFYRFRVEVDGEVVADLDRHLVQVAIGNGSTIGGGTEITPHAVTGDGKLDVMVSFAVGPLSRFGYAALLRVGRHVEHEDVLYVRGSTVSVAGEQFYCSADGELYGPERKRTWHVEPAAFRMPLPVRND
ncbi:diacylglycerol kinase [Nocardioides mesophilus]|uniref:Diacylglycerol kinase n=1 Tax=Nocardioides mesophilus TaxID=433659 RepID=A0A7G9RH21_9ACTN|nr:diacylglycerol kinase [Nocardioides mesophilus]